MSHVWLGHGASGSPATMAPWVEGLRSRGVAADPVALPRGRAERAIVRFAAQVPDAPGMVVGGHSFGGRVATLLAAGLDPAPARRRPLVGVVALSYPLHRPGAPGAWLGRVAHWPSITVPVLLLSGDADPFARLDLLREAVARLPQGRLVVYPGLGHGLAPVRGEALEQIAAFVRSLDVGPGADPLRSAP
jgi:predicted alpha/beta-hydrolase family hydrolase